MHVTFGQATGTAFSTLVVGFVIWLVTVPARQRSVTGLIASVVVTGPLAVLGGIGWALLLGPTVRGPRSALVLAGVAVLSAAAESGVFAARAHRRFCRAQRLLRASLRTMTGDDAKVLARPRLSELEAVRRDLEYVAARLSARYDEQHARDTSFRQLVGWVSADLRVPLTVLQALTDDDANPSPPNVREEIDRLVGVVSDLADLAAAAPDRLPVGSRAAVLTSAQLTDVVDDVLDALSPLLRLRDVTVVVTGDTASRVGLVGPDREDLAWRLLTVVAAAVRAAPRTTSVEIVASYRADDDVLVTAEPAGSALRLPLAAPVVSAPAASPPATGDVSSN